MYLHSINIGHAEPISGAKAIGKTGIFKRPVAGPVALSFDGLPGDTVCDTENHGGADQALYVYSTLDYLWWNEQLGRVLAPGTFGENLTIENLDTAPLQIGDRLEIGAAMIEITAPRLPCVTLARRMDDPTFLKKFRAAERPGLYCRVITPASIEMGDTVTLLPYHGPTIGVNAMFRNFFTPDRSEGALLRQLAAPIASRARDDVEHQLAELRRDQR